MRLLIDTPQRRKQFHNFCSEFLGEDITEVIDIEGKENKLPLVRAALLIKQELMENHKMSYDQMKKEMDVNV